MLRRIEVRNFRALKDVSVPLSNFSILVGPNASGKSTFLDVLAFTRDMLTVGLDKALLGDARFDIPRRSVDPRDMTWMREGGYINIAIEADMPEEVRQRSLKYATSIRYECLLDFEGPPSFNEETIWIGLEEQGDNKKTVSDLLKENRIVLGKKARGGGLSRHNSVWFSVVDYFSGSKILSFSSERTMVGNKFKVGGGRSSLYSIPEDEDNFPSSIWLRRMLSEGVVKIALTTDAIRSPSPPSLIKSFLPDGSNLPLIVQHLESNNPEIKADWTAHLQTAIPDLQNVTTIEREEDRSRYLVLEYKNGLRAPSWLVSDGTLRLLALTLLAYSPLTPPITLIEEPENGIHPQNLETVYQSLSSVYDKQIFCATHSPILLGLAKPSELLCFSRNDDGSVNIVNGQDHPSLRDWQGRISLGDLFAAGLLQ